MLAVVTTFSVSAIADEIPTPDAFENVDATVLASTEAALNGKAEYTSVATARTAVTNTAGALDTALGDQADKNKQIADAQAAITAANALTAGQLIGGQTKAEIVAAHEHGIWVRLPLACLMAPAFFLKSVRLTPRLQQLQKMQPMLLQRSRQ